MTLIWVMPLIGVMPLIEVMPLIGVIPRLCSQPWRGSRGRCYKHHGKGSCIYSMNGYYKVWVYSMTVVLVFSP